MVTSPRLPSRVGLLVLALLALAAAPREKLVSGPQRVTAKIGAFNPLNITGPNAGKKHSLVAAYGARPVAMVLARELSEPVIDLIKRLDAAAVKHEKADLAAFVVVCSTEGKMKDQLEELGKKLALKKTVLTLLSDKLGPKGYDFHPDAEAGAVLYRKRNAQAQFAYRKGELKDRDIDAVIAALRKVLPPCP